MLRNGRTTTSSLVSWFHSKTCSLNSASVFPRMQNSNLVKTESIKCFATYISALPPREIIPQETGRPQDPWWKPAQAVQDAARQGIGQHLSRCSLKPAVRGPARACYCERLTHKRQHALDSTLSRAWLAQCSDSCSDVRIIPGHTNRCSVEEKWPHYQSERNISNTLNP